MPDETAPPMMPVYQCWRRPDRQRFARRLAALVKDREGATDRRAVRLFALRARTSASQLAAWLTGRIEPRQQSLTHICKATACTREWLVGLEGTDDEPRYQD